MEGFLAILNLDRSRHDDCAKLIRFPLVNLHAKDYSSKYIKGKDISVVVFIRKIASDVALLDQIHKFIYAQGWIFPNKKNNSSRGPIILSEDKVLSSGIVQNPGEIDEHSGGFHVLVVNKQKGTMNCFVDRTSSRPVYYSIANNYLIMSSDIRMIYSMPIVDKSLDNSALVQFVRIQTILENRTLYENIKRIPQGSYLSTSENGIRLSVVIRKYWDMVPLDPFDSDEDAIKQTTHEFIQAGSSITRGNQSQKSGILLSGGMDSRAILSMIKPHMQDLTAFTFGMDLNKEVLVGSRIARKIGIPWNFFSQTAIDYLNQLAEVTPILQSHYSIAHTNTFKSAKYMSLFGIQTIYHGGLMDPIFAGSHLPKEYFRIRGRNLYTYRLAPLIANKTAVAQLLLGSRDIQRGDFAASFLDEKYRELWETSSYLAYMHAVDRVAECWESPYDWFEKALMYSGFSEFYTYPVTASIRLFTRERSVLYESNILDLYLRLNVRQRFLGHTYRRAMLSINKEITKIVYPNVGVSPLTHPFIQALSLQSMGFFQYRKDKLMRFLSNVRNTPYHPIPQGCYPSMKNVAGELAKSSAKNIKAYREMLCNGFLVQADIISGAKIRIQLERIDGLEENDALTIMALLSLSNWLEIYPAKI